MSRHRWFFVKWPFGLDRLAKTLKNSAYSVDSSEGFIVDRLRFDQLEARYIQQVVLDETVLDPFGIEMKQRRVMYGQTSFVVHAQRPLVEIVDAGRYTQRFVSRLLEVTDFNLVLSPIEVSVERWARSVLDAVNGNGFVSELQIGGIGLPGGVRGRVTLKGTSDVRPAIGQLMRTPSGATDRITVSLKGEARGTVTLLTNGTARISVLPADDVTEIIRRSLPYDGPKG